MLINRNICIYTVYAKDAGDVVSELQLIYRVRKIKYFLRCNVPTYLKSAGSFALQCKNVFKSFVL